VTQSAAPHRARDLCNSYTRGFSNWLSLFRRGSLEGRPHKRRSDAFTAAAPRKEAQADMDCLISGNG